MFLSLIAEAGLTRLDPPTRARVLMALLGIVLIGIFLVAAILIGARWARRMARHTPRSSREPLVGRKPLLTWRDRQAPKPEGDSKETLSGQDTLQ